MVLAARLRGIPAALTEADAHLGLANRLAAPFARRVLLAYAIDGRDGAKYRVVGRPIPAAHLGAEKAAGRALFGLPADRPVLAVFGGLAGAQALNEFAVEAFGERGPRRPPHLGRARLRRAAAARVARRLRARAVHRRVRSGARGSRPGDLAGRRDGLGARGGRHAGDPRSVSARDGRSPDAERAVLRGGRRGGRRRPERARARAGARRGAAGRPGAARAHERVDARAREAERGGRRRRRADRARRGAVGERSPARRAALLLRRDRRRGARGVRERRARVGRRGRGVGRAGHDLPRGASATSTSRSGASRLRRTASRSSSRRRTRGGSKAGRAPTSSPSSSRCVPRS